ncbi:unnamed protein product [Vicia faba]|uniref:Reverse transcriptase domain-containing protein n=1 Tax=Vicia faba TaxID=3906 RepID=A0AAV0YG28_VICFA|nr:unnamed protein product [Vicia faba]
MNVMGFIWIQYEIMRLRIAKGKEASWNWWIYLQERETFRGVWIRSLNGWLKHSGFVDFVAKSWDDMQLCLCKWNVETFGWVDLAVEEVVKVINVCNEISAYVFGGGGSQWLLDLEAEGVVISKERAGVAVSFWNNLWRCKSMLKQKSRGSGVGKVTSIQGLSETEAGNLEEPFLLEEIRDVCGSSMKTNVQAPKVTASNSFVSVGPLWKMIFIGRKIQDGVVVLNELIDYEKRRFGFGGRWLRWIESYVCNASLPVLINESPTIYFSMGKGFRHGDPLSLFLFTLVAEGLELMIKWALEIGALSGFKLSPSLEFQLLQFVDDTVLLCEPT